MVVLLWWFPTTMTKLLRSGWRDSVTNIFQCLLGNGITSIAWNRDLSWQGLWLFLILIRSLEFVVIFTQSPSLCKLKLIVRIIVQGIKGAHIWLELLVGCGCGLLWMRPSRLRDVVVKFTLPEREAGVNWIHICKFSAISSSSSPIYTTPLLAYDSTRLRNLLTIWSEWIGSPAIKNIIAILGIGRETG